MYPCTHDKNFEMIQPLVQELYQFLVCELLLPSGTYVQNVSGQ
jgi:hypothetical protein